MNLLGPFLSAELVLFAVTATGLHITPREGSIAGGTWITITLPGSTSHQLERSLATGSHLEVSLVNPGLPRLPCDVSPVYFDLSTIRCRTRPSPWEGLYYVEVLSEGRVINNLTGMEKDSSTFKFSAVQTPVVYQISPPSGVPGNLIELYGKTITGRYETLDFNVDYVDGPALLVAEGDGWTSLCSFVDKQAGHIYPVQVEDGLGTLQCRVEGNHIGSHNVSFSVFNKGRSAVHKDAWLISAKQDLFLYQTHSEISSVFPASGSLGGGTELTIVGDFFEEPVQVTVAGVHCKVQHLSPQKIICTTESVSKGRRLAAPQPGNRGLLFEVWDDASDLTETGPGYRWQFVPDASSPVRFLSGAKQSFSSRLRGFFVAPETNNYTFWLQADGQASLYLSLSQDPGCKARIASLPAGNSEWLDHWEKDWSEGWQPKSPKFELTAGSRYYLEAWHHGKAPSSGMRIGVQIHNTWLNPHVVNTYYLERHEIRARALQLPEVQMLTVSGTGWFSISWNNISSNMIPTNATAKQVQRAIEELLSIGCEIEPSSAKILFQNSFEKDTKDSVTTGLIVSGTEPFCGRFSVYRPGQLLKTSSSTLPRYDLTEYTHVCFAHKGYMSKILHISVSYTNVTLHSVKRNLTCQWSFNNRHLESWTFTCTNLWEGCVKHSMLLQDLPANSPVFVRQVDLPFPEEQKEISESFYLDELIITDSNVTVSQQNPKPPWLDGRIIEAVTVVGSSPTYSVSLLVAGCGASLPLLSLRGALLLDGSEEDEHLSVSTEDARVNLTVRRLQKSSPPIGGTFRIYLANAVISGIPVNISSNHLHRLLQGSTNNSTAPYFNSSDFTVSKDSNSCYERIWTLTWKTKTGDLPNVINVSDENLTGLNPTVTSRVVYDGGVFIGPIFGDMLATFNNNTQVVVVVNDVLANCSGSCSFQFSQERTPLVSEVEYLSDGGSQATIVIRGTSFAREKSALQVEVNNSTCHVITLNESKLVCQTERLPVGIYQVMLLVRPYGFALNSSTGEGIFLRVEPKLVAIEPPTASEIGGLRVALRGTSLEGINLVLFGSQPCPISENARNSTRIECQVPSRGMEDAVVPVTLNSGHLSTTVTNLFQYDPSLNPEVVSLSRNRSGIAGGQELQIGISSFAKYQGLDIKVQVGHMWGQIQAQTDHGVNVTLPALAPGWYNISVIINGVAVATSDRIEPLIQYASEIFSTEPCCGSLLGGTLLTISGMGFSQNPALVSVLLNEQACMITHLSEETIWCLTPPAANLSNEDSQDISASVNVLLSNRSLLHASFEKNTTVFNYQRTLTPLITALGAEVTGSSLVLSIQGINITESMAKIGDSECALEFKHGNDSTMLFQCSLPLTNLEPGTYPIRVIQRQLGYAHVAARLQSLTVTPQITSIFPKQGSICGGMVLIISGTALKSRRNLVQVSLEGNYSCEIQNSDNNVIRCFLLPGAHPFPYERLINGSWALNVTVTVNGIGSVCLGDCTFHLHEQWTPFVDLVTWENSGTLTYLMIKGQQLAWPSESPVVHVNNQAVCKVTFWNETNIKCQMDCIAPGKYNISVSSGRSGQACFRRATEVLTVMPQVHQFYPQNFSTNGGGLLTLAGSAMKGKSVTSVLVDRHPCLILNVTCTAIQCLVPPGNGTSALRLRVDGIDYYLGRITYSEEFTPAFLSLVPDGLLLMMTISRVVGTDSIRIFVGDFACSGITITQSMLQCSAPPLPAGEYHVLGLDVLRGWASSNLTFTSRLSVTSVHHNWGGLNGEEFHLRGTGFSPGQTVVTICGTPCEILDNMTTTDLTCLAPRLNASLAILCGLTHSTADCQEAAATFIQCDVQVTVASYHQKQPVFYLYVCDHRGPEQHRGDVNVSHWRFAGLFVSPKVERDEVLIYNSSCNITMETEAEMECEGANQPITAKITEIWKNWGQNTQVPLQFCGRWAEERSWPAGHQPRDGDSVTIEGGRTLLLGTTTSILNLLHLKGGKLVFTGPGPVELHAHYILITDGGELHVGSSKAPFHHKAHIYLYGSLHSSPVFPYGIKFMAVRNGTLSMHGWMPKVAVTHLKSPARAKDTRLVLQEPVDWRAGDEILVGGTGLGDAPQQEERAVIESVNSTELYLTSPLRYFHSVGEEGVNGQVVPLSAVVALISRRVVVQGNVTRERMSHLRQCANAGVSGDGSRCLYERSERKLGSQDLGAVVVVEALQGEDSHLWVEGVQFWHMGQAFRHHRSALTIMGNTQMADSYIRGSCILDSFGQGLRLTGISNLTVDNNIFFNISGHGILLGEGLEKGNRVSNNIVIGLSGSDGLSSIEALSPAGIYIRAPANHIEGNMVCAAGYGYLFHLDPEGPSWIPLLSFSENVAHSCTRTGLLVYPEYLPESLGSPVQMHSFMAWNNQGGAQIFSSSNLELQSFQIFACKDFGIDIIESLGNTSVTNSFLIGHFGQKDRTCMSAGLKTPKRYQLFVSNTTFGNFDVSTCAAIGTCSGCYQGQGGFTVSTERLTFINAPYQVSFPFPHSAVLADLDGSVTGHEGSYLLPSTAIVETSCAASANLSQASKGSVCKRDLVIHRMSIHLKEAPDMPYNLTVADSRNKTITVNYVPDTLSNLYGWVVLLLDKETYALTFDNPLVNKQLQYSATFSNFMMGNYLLVEHKNLSAYTEVVVSCGIRTGQPLQSLPSYGHHQSCDWYLNTRLRKLTYLVTGADLIQVTLKERVPLPTPVPSDAVLKWSHPETWNDVGKGWGGSNSSIPGAGEDVIILPNRTILVDTALPPLRGLYILGTLEFPSNSSNVLSAACIVLVGGTLRVGSFQHPLEGSLKLLILLRASEGIYCDRLEGINIHAGSIGVYGKLQIHSAYPRRSWTHLGTNIAPGNERIFLEDEVDWNRGGHIVISSSSYEAHQAEVVTLKEINGRSIRIHERILHRHIGCSHDTEDGRQIPLAAEVGLLTRNVQIKSDVACTGRMLVGRFRDSRGTEFEGVLQLLNIEFLNFGPPQLSAIEFRNVTQGSLMVSSSIHGSCGSGIKAVTSNGIWLHENVVFNTFGPGIDLEGQNHSLIRNLVILSRQPEGLLNWVAGIKVNLVIDVSLHGNVVAGSDRIAFHIRGQECLSDGDYCSENVAHSSLHGVHLFRDDGFQTCTKITGFLSYKNYDYGIMFHLGSSVIVDSVVLVDNNVGLLPVVYCLCAEQCRRGKRFIELRNSVIVATSSTFDCIKDRIKPLSADLTSGDRPPSYPRRGRVGILWPTFTTTFSQRPDNPWHKIGHCLKVLGHMKIKEVTFTGFIKSCHSEDRDVCIMSSTDQLDVMPLITAERSRMLQVNEKDKFYFYQPPESVQTSEDITVPEKRCTNSRKALFKDLDGGILDLEPPASVFPKSEFESTQFYLQAGIYREDNKCTFNPSVQGYFCKQTAHTLVILENLDPSRVNQRLSPVLAMTDSFMDTFSDVTSNAGCYPAEHPPAFSAVLPSNKLTTVCFPDLPPATFRLYLLSGQNSTRLPLAIFYNEPLSLRVFIQGKYVSPTLSSFSLDEGLGTNYFNFENNLLYVLLHGEEPVEIVTGLSLHIAFSLPETTGEESETRIIYRLADFLQIGHDQIRIVYRVLGGENILKVISSNVRKRRYHCPKMTFCTASYTRAGSQGVRRRSIRSRTLQPSAIAVPSKVLVIELGDPPGHGRSEFNRSLTIDSLKSWARTIIITHQTGDLQRGLDLPVDTLMVTQPSFLSPEGDNNRNGSRQNSGTCLYVRPYNISVRVQPSDGEMEKPLPVQPQIIFLDRKGKRVDKLGLPSEPWVVSAHLKGSSEAVLKGITAVEVIDGYASFTNLAVSRAGTNWNLLFTVTSPPGVEFTVLSQPFTIFPVLLQEKSSMILVILSSGVSTLVLGLFAFCCLKKSKSKKRRTEQGETRQRAEARTNAPQTRAQPHSAHHLQPCCNRGEKESGFSAKGGKTCLQEFHKCFQHPNEADCQSCTEVIAHAVSSKAICRNTTNMEENGAVGDARGQLKEVNQQSVEASSDGKTNTVHDNDSYQEPCGGASPGASLAPQQLAVPPLSSWEDASQSSAAHNEKREKAKKVPKFQKDTTEDIAMEAADTWEK